MGLNRDSESGELFVFSSSSRITRRTFNAGFAAAGLYSYSPKAMKIFLPSESPVKVQRSEIAYLMGDQAQRPASIAPKPIPNPGPKRFWVEGWRDTEQVFEWTVSVEQAGEYEVTLMVSAPPGSLLGIEGPSNKLQCETTRAQGRFYSWDRITLESPLSLPKGNSTIRLRLLKPLVSPSPFGAALKSIELLNVAARPELNARIQAFRSDTSWLSEAKFGFMCQCGEWSYPPHGPHKPWPAMVDQFDVEKFADMVDSTGAGYAIWSATWSTYFFPAPIQAIDRIIPGRTSKRDLIGDIQAALAKRNIRLMLYYHLGHEVTPQNGSWWSKNWVSESDTSLFYDNWCSILEEVGQRYGDRLAGWMFDDELVYYPAPYERLGKAAKTGSRSRIISYNPWIQPRGTDFQDFQFGEGYMGSPDLPVSAQGIWPSGPMKGLHAHGCFQTDRPDWGINKPDTKIETIIPAERGTQMALDAAERNEALSWNLMMYDDGSVSETSLAIMQAAGRAVRKKYPRAKP